MPPAAQDPAALPLGTPGPMVPVEGDGEAGKAAAALLAQARREVLVLVDPPLAAAFDLEAADAVADLVARRPPRPLRLLVTDAADGFRALPRMVELARRFGSFIKLRALAPEEAPPRECYLLFDAAAVVHQPDREECRFRVHTRALALARRLQADFEGRWPHAAPLPGVHTLGLGR